MRLRAPAGSQQQAQRLGRSKAASPLMQPPTRVWRSTSVSPQVILDPPCSRLVKIWQWWAKKKEKKSLRSPQARSPPPVCLCAFCMLDALTELDSFRTMECQVESRGFCQWRSHTSGLTFPPLVYSVGNSKTVSHATLNLSCANYTKENGWADSSLHDFAQQGEKSRQWNAKKRKQLINKSRKMQTSPNTQWLRNTNQQNQQTDKWEPIRGRGWSHIPTSVSTLESLSRQPAPLRLGIFHHRWPCALVQPPFFFHALIFLTV